MAAQKLIILLLFTMASCLLLSAAGTREIMHETLESRLRLMTSLAAGGGGGDGGGGLVECWNALVELRSCTNEIVLFFLNGESYLGQECCRAIRLVTHHCWPAMLASVGFTAEEGDILKGYCDATVAPTPPSGDLPPTSPPAPAPSSAMIGTLRD